LFKLNIYKPSCWSQSAAVPDPSAGPQARELGSPPSYSSLSNFEKQAGMWVRAQARYTCCDSDKSNILKLSDFDLDILAKSETE